MEEAVIVVEFKKLTFMFSETGTITGWLLPKLKVNKLLAKETLYPIPIISNFFVNPVVTPVIAWDIKFLVVPHITLSLEFILIVSLPMSVFM